MKPVFAFQGLPIGLKEEKEKLYIINKKREKQSNVIVK